MANGLARATSWLQSIRTPIDVVTFMHELGDLGVHAQSLATTDLASASNALVSLGGTELAWSIERVEQGCPPFALRRNGTTLDASDLLALIFSLGTGSSNRYVTDRILRWVLVTTRSEHHTETYMASITDKSLRFHVVDPEAMISLERVHDRVHDRLARDVAPRLACAASLRGDNSTLESDTSMDQAVVVAQHDLAHDHASMRALKRRLFGFSEKLTHRIPTVLLSRETSTRVVATVINERDYHWSLLVAVGEDEATDDPVFICFDSLGSRRARSVKRLYEDRAMLMASAGLVAASAVPRIHYAQVDPQEDAWSCGWHVIARALALRRSVRTNVPLTAETLLDPAAPHMRSLTTEECRRARDLYQQLALGTLCVLLLMSVRRTRTVLGAWRVLSRSAQVEEHS